MNKFKVIYADPPWTFKTYSKKGLGRSAEAHYDCMDLEAIKALGPQVKDWADKDSVLLMWVTDPFLQKGFEVIESWGFKYKTVGFYWVKTKYIVSDNGMYSKIINPIGTGYWSRANPEQCLLATKGHPKRLNADVHKLVNSERRQHSQKPDEMYSKIERLCEGPYLEMFARQTAPGWTAWGNEVETGPGVRRWSSKGYPEQCVTDSLSP